MIAKVDIQNFKSIRQQTVELGELNVLIGQNGAGKSNFISLFKLLEQIASGNLQTYIFQSGGINQFLHGGFEQSQGLSLSLEFSRDKDNYNIYEVDIETDGEAYRIADEVVGYWNKREYNSPIRYPTTYKNRIETLLNNVRPDSREYDVVDFVRSYLNDLKVYHFRDTSPNAKNKVPQPIDDVYSLQTEAENIAPMLLHFSKEHPDVYYKIVETVRLIYPPFDNFVLQESPQARGHVLLRWREQGSSYLFSVRQMSDGLLQFVCLATLLIQPQFSQYVPNTILIDEPELGLHPFAIKLLSELLYTAARHRQIIVSTQSVSLVNKISLEDVIVVEREERARGSAFKRLESNAFSEWLEDYTLGQLWESNMLGGRP